MGGGIATLVRRSALACKRESRKETYWIPGQARNDGM